MIEIVAGNAGSALVIAVVAVIVGRLLRRPALTHLLWLLVLLRLLAPPLVELAMLPATAQPVATAPVFTASMNHRPSAPIAPTATQDSLSSAAMLRFGFALWCGGSACFLALAVTRTMRLRRLLMRATPAGDQLAERVRSIARRLGIDQPPPAQLIPGGAPPMVWSALRSPSLILPRALVDTLDAAELDSLLAHELAHLKRRDHWVRIVELLSSTLFWWYPLLWWARRRLRVAEELCCDAVVATHLPDHRRAYAQCLLKTVRYLRIDPRMVVAGSAMANLDDLKGRITMIMKPPAVGPSSLPSKLALAALAVCLLVLSPTLSARNGDLREYDGDPITLSLQDADFEDVLATFARITGVTFALDPAVHHEGLLDDPITVEFVATPWDEALDTMLGTHGLGWTRQGEVLWIHSGEHTIDPSPDFSGDAITLNLRDADIHDVMATFAKISGQRFELAPEVTAKITLDVEQLPWDQVLDMMLRVNGLAAGTTSEGVVQIRRVASSNGTVLSPHPSGRSFGPEDSFGKPTPELLHGGRKVFRYVVDGPISAPLKVEGPAPNYPEEARKAGTQGVVILESIIDATGEVSDIQVIRGLPNGLTQAATEAVKRWRFEPARLDGEPVAVILLLSVHFHLDSSEKPD